MMRRISSLTLLAGLLAAGPVLADNLYRWVDDQGKVHFTKTLPPEAADRPYDIYSSQGVLLESVADPREKLRQEREAAANANGGKPKPLYTEEQKQSIGDRLLLLKYRSEDEILEAMNLEIDHLKYDTRILEASHNSLMNSLSGQIAIAAGRQRAGLAIEDRQRQEIDLLRRRLRDNQAEMSRMAERKDTIRASFDEELERYRHLIATAQEEEPAGD